MLESQSLQLKLSEIRQKINGLGDGDEVEYRAEEMDALTLEYRQLESKYRVAVIRESEEIEATPTGDLDSEKREMRGMETSLELRNYIHSAMTDEALTGTEAEYNAANLLSGVGTAMPWMALLSPEERAEMRAATTAPANSDTVVRSILGRVFSASAADHLGVTSQMVPVGSTNFPVLTNGAIPANAAAAGAADETAATLTPNVLDPLRLTASYRMRREDLAKLTHMEDTLRMDLAGAMMESRDKGIIAGDGSAPNVNGFLSELTNPTNPSAEATFGDYASARASKVDGRYAMSEDDVKLVVGVDTYTHAAKIYQTGSGISALSRLNAKVSAHVTAAGNNNIQANIASLSMGRAVCPMWPAIELIRDIYSHSNKSEIVLTATALWNFKVLDESGFSLIEFKLA